MSGIFSIPSAAVARCAFRLKTVSENKDNYLLCLSGNTPPL